MLKPLPHPAAEMLGSVPLAGRRLRNSGKMAKWCTTFAIFLFSAMGAFAQTITIGSGTTTNGTTTAAPINQYYRSLRFQSIYTPAEINAAGYVGAGTITQLGLYITGTPTNPLPNYSIKMANVSQANLSTAYTGALTTVYSDPSYEASEMTANAWNLLTLNTPFMWDGTSNIIVDWCFDQVMPTYSSTGQVRIFTPTVSAGSSRFVRLDSAPQCGVTPSTTQTTKPQLQMTFIPAAACSGTPAPGNTISSANPVCPSTTFTLTTQNATPGSGVTYQWQSADDMAFTQNVTNLGTSAGQSTMQSADKYYRVLVTCAGATTPSNPVLVTTSPFTNCYCTPLNSTNCSSAIINNVTIAGTSLNNTTGCTSTTNSYTAYPATGSTTATLVQGTPYSLSVTTNYAGGYISVWIDYNQNGVFESTEWQQVASANTVLNAPSTVVVNIPATALTGATGMRIRSRTSTPNGAPDACTSFGSGESEDYIVTIVAPSPCVNPDGGNAVAANAFLCGSGSTTITNNTFSIGTGTSYEWETSTDNFVANVTGTGQTNPASFTTGTITSTTYYRLRVECSGAVEYSNQVAVEVRPVPTATAVSNSPVCEGSTLTLTGTTDIGTTYTWTGPNSFTSSSQNPVIGNVALAAAGTYTFRATANGCTSAVATAMVQVLNGVTNPSAAATPATVCAGEAINLTSMATTSGYSMNTACSTGFIDISATGTSVGTISDDSEHNITLPFAFTFNGASYTTARVGTNGVVSFGSTTGDVSTANSCLPSTIGAGNAAAVIWWDDLDLSNLAGVTSSIKTEQVGSVFIIQWTDIAHNLFQGGAMSFQIQLEQTTNKITFVYSDVVMGNATYDNGLAGTIGLNFSGTSALQYSCNTASLSNGQCISFTPLSISSYSWTGPNGFYSNDQNPVIANASVANSGTYTVTFSNAGGCTNVATATVTVNAAPAAMASSNSPVTEGDNISLTASGGTTYTWTGPNGFTSFDQNPTITGATLADAGIYTVTVSDGSCSATATTTVVVNPIPTQLNGIYTINQTVPASATNFVNFTSAAAALNTMGVGGPVTINVVAGTGPYNETVMLSQIPGSSATNMVTIIGNGNVLNGCATSANRAIVRLDGTDNLAINGLTLNATCNFGWGFHLMGDVENVTISNNTINLSASQSVFIGSMAGVVATNSTTNPQTAGGMLANVTINGNTITNGYHGIRLEGVATGLGTGLVVANNTLTTPMGYGIDVRNMSNPTISGNDVAMRTGAGYLSNNSTGIVVVNTENGLTVNGNSVHSAGIFGLMLQNVGRTTNTRGMVANNMIGGNFQNTSVVHAVQLNNASNLDIYYNSTWADNGASGSGFYVSNQFSRNLDMRNNSFAYTGAGTGYALQANNGNSNFSTINYNNYYTSGARFVRYAGADRMNLAQLQIAPNGQNMQSMSANPMYVGATNLHLQAGSPLIGQAAALASVSVDFDGDARTGATDIGADEYMVTVRVANNALTAEVYPNPFHNALTVKLSDVQTGAVQVILTDLMGRQIISQQFGVEAGATSLSLPVEENIAQGVYLLQVRQGEATSTFRVVKH